MCCEGPQLEYRNLNYLSSLSLGANYIHGPIPTSLCDLTDLLVFDLSDNQLTGFVPQHLGDIYNMIYQYIYNHYLRPDYFINMFLILFFVILQISLKHFSFSISSQMDYMAQFLRQFLV